MEQTYILTFIIIGITAFITNKGLKEFSFKRKYLFQTGSILNKKEYIRLFSSGFLHADWTHFMFNMLSLYFLGSVLEKVIGIPLYALVYIVSLLGGNLFSLYLNRNNSNYTALGASGAVSGVIFATIGLIPGMQLNLLFIPIPFPAWVYAILFVGYSIYGMKAKNDNIGHDAHLGGAIAGLLTAIVIKPQIIFTNWLPIVLSLVPTIIFLVLLLKKQNKVFTTPFKKQKGYMTIDDQFNERKAKNQHELNQLLDKVGKVGYEKLSSKEKQRLKDLSK